MKYLLMISFLLSILVIPNYIQFNVNATEISKEDLIKQVSLLTQAVLKLEKRVNILETKVKKLENLGSNTLNQNKNISQLKLTWRKLVKGMSYQQVRNILGEPDHIDAGVFTNWRYYYNNNNKNYFGGLTFYEYRLFSWNEP